MATSPEIPFDKRREEPATFRARQAMAAFTVKDVAASLKWYRDVAAFMVDEEIVRNDKLVSVVFTIGEVRFLINQDDGAKGWDRKKGEGFSIQFTTAQDIDLLAKGMKERGAVLDTEPADMPWGARMFRFRDPDGFMLSIST